MNAVLNIKIGIFAVAVGLLTAAWFESVAHMFNLVVSVDVFSHGQIIPFVSIGLIWFKKDHLAKVPSYFWLPGLLVLVGASFLWLVGEVFELKIAGHLAYIIAIQSLVLTLWGPVFFRAILFPMLFLLMIVPAGQSLIPILQYTTADMVIWMLSVLGVPYTVDGVLITLSSGIYEVAQACAGIKFLFTSLVTGVLLAHLIYRSWKRRFLIILASIGIPVFANAFRVLGILLIAESTDQSFAKGVDHIVYGWGFLSFVLIILITVAYRFSDKIMLEEDDVTVFANLKQPVTSNVVAVIVTVCLVALPSLAAYFAPVNATVSKNIKPKTAPECENCSVRLLKRSQRDLLPVPFEGADAALSARYRIGADYVLINSALYCPQRTGARLPSAYMSVPKSWVYLPGVGAGSLTVGNWAFEEIHYKLGNSKKVVWLSKYIAGEGRVSSMDIKLAAAKERILWGKSAGAVLAVTIPVLEGAPPPQELFEKFFSRFSPDDFLWDEIKPTKEGHNICVA